METDDNMHDDGPITRVDNTIHACPYCGETLMGPPMEYTCPMRNPAPH